MGKVFTITLDGLDVGQLLDGLRARAQAWRATADYMESGTSSDPFFVCEECTDTEEAVQVAEHFERVIRSIEEQIAEQGGW